MKVIIRVIEVLLWVVFGVILSLFVYGLINFDGSLKEYTYFLSGRNRSQEIRNVRITQPTSFFHMVLQSGSKDDLLGIEIGDGIIGTGMVISGAVYESGSEVSGDIVSGEIDVYDPNFKEEFDSYFEGGDTATSNENIDASDGEGFGFKK